MGGNGETYQSLMDKAMQFAAENERLRQENETLYGLNERLREALPNPDILDEVAISLENRGVGPPGHVEHLRARAHRIRAALKEKEAGDG